MSKHLPEKVNNIGQTVGINHEGKGLGQNDDGHIALEAHLGQAASIQRKSAGLMGQIIIKIKKRSKRLPLSNQPIYLS